MWMHSSPSAETYVRLLLLSLLHAGLQLRSSTFHALAARCKALADELCGGRLVFLLEGGYDLKALGESVANTFLGEGWPAAGSWKQHPASKH
jgi:acetoin utilization deacetylase AcuC-like enzyme